MKYDTVSARCLGAAYVRACGGHPTTPAPEVTTEEETEAPEEETTTEAFEPTEEVTTEEVTECEEEETTTEAVAEEPTTEEEETTTEAEEETTTEEITETSEEATTTVAASPCEGRPFGVYGHGCSSSYTICLSHVHLEKHCPSPLRYDPVSHTCISVKLISACGGVSRPAGGVGQAF